MRTTVDLPDALMKRVKSHTNEGSMTFRSLVISALEKVLEEDIEPFTMRDASVGISKRNPVTTEVINQVIDEHRAIDFQS